MRELVREFVRGTGGAEAMTGVSIEGVGVGVSRPMGAADAVIDTFSLSTGLVCVMGL